MSSRNKIAIIGVGVSVSLLDRMQRQLEEAGVVVIKDTKDLKDFKDLNKPEPMIIKAPIMSDLIQPIRSIHMGDMGNTYPTPHKSSKRSKKW